MFYTLLKFLGWGLLLAFIGGCIGWALRALKARSELTRARSSMVDADETERLRTRVADLEQVVAERDRLRIQLADVRHADSPGIVGADVPPPDAPEPDDHRSAGPDHPLRADDGSVASEHPIADAPKNDLDDDLRESPTADPDGSSDDLGGPMDEHSHDVVAEDLEASPIGTDSDAEADRSSDREIERHPDSDRDRDPDLDLRAARAVLGKTITLDDLTVVEGIGPKISELCSGVGVTTWRQLADTDVAELQSILDAAGSRYSVHKPATWSHQAELLATGRWSEFRAFTEELKRSR